MQGNRKAGAAVSALLITGVAAAAAHAADAPAPPPKPCTTASVISDPFGDSVTTPLPLNVDELKQPAPDNMDLGGFYLTTDENGTAFVNIKLKNANLTLPQKTTSVSGIAYYFSYYNVDGTENFVSATISNDAIDGNNPTGAPNTNVAATDGNLSFGVGNVDPTTGSYSTSGSGSGTLFPGKNGVVQIQLPDVFAGDTITDVVLGAFGRTDAVLVSSLPSSDVAPEGGDAGTAGTGIKSYDVPTCASVSSTAVSATKSRAARRTASRKGLKVRARRAHR
jgi:hypothetical protein